MELDDWSNVDNGIDHWWNKKTATTKNLKGKYCPKLFEWFEVDPVGNVRLCCSSWLPQPIGNLLDNTLEEIWNSDRAIELRNQVFTGDWKYCDHELCPVINSDTLPDINDEHHTSPYVEGFPKIINFCNDSSCNLMCPSCRNEKILLTSGPQYEKSKLINDRICEGLFSRPTDQYFAIFVTGAGDPFASKIFREMLQNIDGSMFPRLEVNLQTNGTMMTPKMWQSLHKIHDRIKFCRISLDAGCKDTYENKVRLNGNWDLLLENCKYLDSQVPDSKQLKVMFDFVVQYDNYKEMKDYVTLCLNTFKNIYRIHISLITDWGTWPSEIYKQKCIWSDSHPEYQQFLSELNDPIFDHPLVDMTNVTSIRNTICN